MPQAMSTLNLVDEMNQVENSLNKPPGENHGHCPQLPDEVGDHKEGGEEPAATPWYIHVLPKNH